MKNMTKLILGAVLTMTILSGCGNKSLLDTKWTFDKANIKIGDVYETVSIKSWKDYEDGIVQVVSTDGAVYLTHQTNVVLIGK